MRYLDGIYKIQQVITEPKNIRRVSLWTVFLLILGGLLFSTLSYSSSRAGIDFYPDAKDKTVDYSAIYKSVKPGSKEVVSKRAQNQKVFDNGDGTEQYIISQGPLHFKDAGGAWQNIDSKITATQDGSGYEMNQSIYSVKLDKNFTSEKLAQISKDGQDFLMTPGELSLANNTESQLISVPKTSTAEGSEHEVTYKDAYGKDLNFSYETQDFELKKKLTIPSFDSLPTPSIDMSDEENSYLKLDLSFAFTSDLEILIDGKQWNGKEKTVEGSNIVFQKDGKVLWQLTPAKAWDSSVIASGARQSIILGKTVISKASEKLNLQVQFPYSWLKTAQYPVTIDPDTYYGATTDGQIAARNATYATAHSTSTSVQNTTTTPIKSGQTWNAGPGYDIWRTYLEFYTADINDSYVVSQANLYLTVSGDGSTTDFTVRVHEYNWTSPLATGTREADYDGALAATANAVDWQSTSGMSLNTPYASANLRPEWVKLTAGSPMTRYSLLSDRDVASTTPSGGEYVDICAQEHATQAYRPYLSITASAPAATRYWIDNDGGNWNDTANWSASSGGTGGETVPTTGDTAIFDNASSTHNGALTLDVAVSIGTLTFDTNYTGTITPGSYSITTATAMSLTGNSLTMGAALTASGTLTIASGKTLTMAGNNITVSSTFSNSGTLKLTGGEATVSLTNDVDSGTVEYYGTSGPYTTKNLTYNNLKLNGAATTYNQYGGAIVVNGTFNLAAGTYVQGANDLTVKDDFTIASSGSTFTKGTGAAKLKFLGDLIFTGPATAQNLGAVEIGASPDTTELAADWASDSLTINAGDIYNTNGYEVDIGTGGITIATGSPGGTLDTTDDVETDGTIITCAGNFTIGAGGVFTKDATAAGGGISLVKMDGGATKTLTSDGDDLGAFQTSVASTHIDLQDNLITDAITIDASTTLDTVSGSNRSITAAGNVAISGTLLANASTITVAGDWTHAAGTFTRGTSLVHLTGTKAVDVANNYADGQTFYDLTIADPTKTTTVTNSIGLTHLLTLGSGTVTSVWKSIAIFNTITDYTPLVIDAGVTITQTGVSFLTTTGVKIPASTKYSSLGCTGTDSGTDNICTLQGNVTVAVNVTVNGWNAGNKGVMDTGGYTVSTAYVYIGTNGTTTKYGKLIANASSVSVLYDMEIYADDAGGDNILDAGSSTFSFYRTSSTQILRSNAQSFFNLSHTGAGTLHLEDALNVDGAFINSSGTLDAATHNVAMNFGGNFTNSATFTSGTGACTFDGTTAQTIITGGTGVGQDFDNLRNSNTTSTVSLSTNAIDIDGVMTIDASANFRLMGQNLTVTTTMTNNGTLTLYGSETATIPGGAPQTIGGTVVYTGDTDAGVDNYYLQYWNYNNLTINSSDGVTDNYYLNGNTSVGGNFALTAGEFSTNDPDSAVDRNLTITGNVVISGTLYVIGDTIGTVTVGGNWDNASGTITMVGDWILDFNKGSSTQTLISGGTGAGKAYDDINHTGAGTLQLSTNAINIDGDFNNSVGTFDANSQNIEIAGNWTVAVGATFTSGTGTVNLNGTGNQTFTAGGTDATHDYYNLTVSNSSTITWVTFADSVTLVAGGRFTAVPDAHLKFNDGSTYTFPFITLDGTVGHNIFFSYTAGAHGHSHMVVSQAWPTASYITVDHNDATGSWGHIDATDNGSDGGSTIFWDFTVGSFSYLTTDQADYPGHGDLITADARVYNSTAGTLYGALDYVIFIDANANNTPDAGETYVTSGCAGSAAWAVGNYTWQNATFDVDAFSYGDDQQSCTNTNFPSVTTYTLWAKWYDGGATTYDTEFTTFTSVPTLTQILFMVLVGSAIFLGVRSKAIKVKKDQFPKKETEVYAKPIAYNVEVKKPNRSFDGITRR